MLPLVTLAHSFPKRKVKKQSQKNRVSVFLSYKLTEVTQFPKFLLKPLVLSGDREQPLKILLLTLGFITYWKLKALL